MKPCTYIPVETLMTYMGCFNILMILSTLCIILFPRMVEKFFPPALGIIVNVIIIVVLNWAVFSSIAPSPAACSYILNQ